MKDEELKKELVQDKPLPGQAGFRILCVKCGGLSKPTLTTVEAALDAARRGRQCGEGLVVVPWRRSVNPADWPSVQCDTNDEAGTAVRVRTLVELN